MKPVFLSLGPSKEKAAPSKRIHEDEASKNVQRLSEFRPGTAPQLDEPQKARKIIPCKRNQQLSSKTNPDALGDLKDKFQKAERQPDGPKVYGLVQANKVKPAGIHHGPVDNQRPASKTSWQSQSAVLPEAPKVGAYEDMPVEDFGMALLLGMGMSQEKKVETVEYISRPSRMGLGAKPGDMGAYHLERLWNTSCSGNSGSGDYLSLPRDPRCNPGTNFCSVC
jgi:hypothetical protein